MVNVSLVKQAIHNIDESFLISIINTFLNENYFPEEHLRMYNINNIIEYLEKTNAYYEQFQLPNIERHFNLLINKSESDNGNLHLLKTFFLELKQELMTLKSKYNYLINLDNENEGYHKSVKEAIEYSIMYEL